MGSTQAPLRKSAQEGQHGGDGEGGGVGGIVGAHVEGVQGGGAGGAVVGAADEVDVGREFDDGHGGVGECVEEAGGEGGGWGG